jgi:lysophospholipase L1-like esterase
MKMLVCLGDSLTEGAEVASEQRWPKLVSDALLLKTMNCGIGGDTTQGMLCRFYPEVVAVKPDAVLVMGGTNDLWWGTEVHTIAGNLFSIVSQARYHQIFPAIGLPLPVHQPALRKPGAPLPLDGYHRFCGKFSELIGVLETAARENDVPLVDFYRSFLNPRGDTQKDLFLEDGLHPNRQGHVRMAEKVVELFRRQHG